MAVGCGYQRNNKPALPSQDFGQITREYTEQSIWQIGCCNVNLCLNPREMTEDSASPSIQSNGGRTDKIMIHSCDTRDSKICPVNHCKRVENSKERKQSKVNLAPRWTSNGQLSVKTKGEATLTSFSARTRVRLLAASVLHDQGDPWSLRLDWCLTQTESFVPLL